MVRCSVSSRLQSQHRSQLSTSPFRPEDEPVCDSTRVICLPHHSQRKRRQRSKQCCPTSLADLSFALTHGERWRILLCLFLRDWLWPPLVSWKVAPRDVHSLLILDAVDVTLTRDKTSADGIGFGVGPCRTEAAVTEDKGGKCGRLKKRGLTTSGPVEGRVPRASQGAQLCPGSWKAGLRTGGKRWRSPASQLGVRCYSGDRKPPTPVESLPLPGGPPTIPGGSKLQAPGALQITLLFH